MKQLVYLFLLAMLFAGCKTKYVTAPEYHLRDSTKMVYQRDSIYTHDSVFVSQYIKGDTVYIERNTTSRGYKNSLRHDTVTIVRVDTIIKPVVVEKKVVEYKYISHWYDGFCRRFTLIVIACVALALLAWYVRKRK